MGYVSHIGFATNRRAYKKKKKKMGRHRGSSTPSSKGSGCTRGEATARVVTMRTTHASRWVVRRVASGGNVSTSNREIKRSLMLF
jgi:hypothetical protein